MRQLAVLCALTLAGLLAATILVVRSGMLEEQLRRTVIWGLERTLGREVAIQRIRGDPWRGVVLEDLRIAEGRTFREGTLLRVPTVLITFDVEALFQDLLWGKRAVLPAVRQIVLREPTLILVRDRRGSWNVEALFRQVPQPAGPAGPTFTGTVEFRGSVVRLLDLSVIPAFRATLTQVTGHLGLDGLPLIRLTATGQAMAGNAPRSPVRVAGWVHTAEGTLDLEVEATDLPLAAWGHYLAPVPRIRWEGGWVGGTVHLYGGTGPSGRPLDFSGLLRLRRAALTVLPEGVRLWEISGLVRGSRVYLTTPGLRLRVGRSPVTVRGEVLLSANGYLDLEVETAGLDAALVRRLFFPGAVPIRGPLQGRLRLTGAPQTLRISGRIRSPEVVVAHQPLRSLTTQLTFEAGTLALTGLEAQTAGGGVRGDLLLDPGGSVYLFAGDVWRVPTTALEQVLGLALPLRAALSGPVVATGGPGWAVVQGAMRAGPGSILGIPFNALQASFAYVDGDLWLEAASLERYRTRVDLWGTISAEGGLDLFAIARDLPLTMLRPYLPPSMSLAGTLQFSGRIRGRSAGSPRNGLAFLWGAQGQVMVRRGRIGPVAFDEGISGLVLDPEHLVLADATVRQGRDLYRVAGEVRWAPLAHLDLTVRTEGADASRLASWANLPVALGGEASGEVHLTGTPQRPRATAEVRLRGGRVLDHRVDEARARLVWDPSELQISQGWAKTDLGALQVEGRVRSDRLDLTFSLDGLRLESVAAMQLPSVGVRGSVRLSGRMGGTSAHPVVAASAQSTDLTLNGVRFDGATGSVYWTPGTLGLAPLAVTRGSERYTLEGTVDLEGPTASLRLLVDGGRLSTLLAVSRSPLAADGRLSGTLTLTGPLANPQVHLDLRLGDGHLSGYPIRSARGELLLRDREVTIRSLEVTPQQGALRAQGTFNLRGETNVEVSGEDVEIDAFRPILQLRTPPLYGRADFTLQLSGTLRAPVAGLSLEMRDAGSGPVQVDRVLGQVFYREGTLAVEQLLVEEQGYRARLAGRIPVRPETFQLDPGGALSLRLATDDIELGVLRRLLPGLVEDASGVLRLQVDVDGTPASPRMEGFGRVQNGRVKLAPLDPAIEAIRAGIRFDQQSARIEQLEARLGEGSIQMGGGVTFRGLSLDRVDLSLQASGVRLGVRPVYQGMGDADLRLLGPADGPTLTGQIILRAGELLLGLPAAPQGSRAPGGIPVRLDLDLRAGRELAVRLGPLRLGVDGRLRLGGTLAQPVLEGTVTTTGGEFTAFGRTFRLESGSATFQAFRGTTPLLSARARTEVGEVTVFAVIQGMPGDLQVRLESDPPLPPDRIGALLLGEAGVPEAVRGEVERLLRQQLSRIVLGEVAARLRQALGLGELRLEYDFESPLRLRIGRLLVQNLYLTLTTTFAQTVQFVWALEYRFSPSTALALTYDPRGPWLVFLRTRFVW